MAEVYIHTFLFMLMIFNIHSPLPKPPREGLLLILPGPSLARVILETRGLPYQAVGAAGMEDSAAITLLYKTKTLSWPVVLIEDMDLHTRISCRQQLIV